MHWIHIRTERREQTDETESPCMKFKMISCCTGEKNTAVKRYLRTKMPFQVKFAFLWQAAISKLHSCFLFLFHFFCSVGCWFAWIVVMPSQAIIHFGNAKHLPSAKYGMHMPINTANEMSRIRKSLVCRGTKYWRKWLEYWNQQAEHRNHCLLLLLMRSNYSA